MESSDAAIMSKTLDGVITSWNPAAERLYGYTAPEIVGQPIARLVPQEYLDELPTVLYRLRQWGSESAPPHGRKMLHRCCQDVRVRFSEGPPQDCRCTETGWASGCYCGEIRREPLQPTRSKRAHGPTPTIASGT
jgi:PAS domain S-box-containing protein